MATPLSRIIFRLVRWVKRRAGLDRPSTIGELIASSPSATFWKIANTQPGVCGCWQICHRDADSDLVITLISLQQLREDLGQLHRGNLSASRTAFSRQLSGYLVSQGGLSALQISHIFVVLWRTRNPSAQRRGKNGKFYRASLVRPLVAVPGDFQGVSNAWTNGDRYAFRVAEAIGKRLLRLEEGRLNTWEELVNAIDWSEWLEVYLKQFLGPSHVFQPKNVKAP